MGTTVLGKEVKIDFNGKTYLIKKMALGKYAKFAEKLEEVFPSKAAMETLITGEPAARIEVMLGLFKSAPLKVAELVHIGSDIPIEEITEGLPEDVLDLLEQLYKLNELDKLGARIKKAFGLGRIQG